MAGVAQEPKVLLNEKPVSHQVLDYLCRISGKQTVAGQHNDLKIVEEPFKWTEAIHVMTGRHPGLWSSDFSFDYRLKQRWKMVHEAERQWKAGAIINLMWHACPPTCLEPCTFGKGIKSHLTDDQWHELISEGSPLQNVWLQRVDSLAPYLRYLEEQGVEVLFRPLHEMNHRAFWWGGRPGPNGTRRLYQITHDRLAKYHGLQNLVWVWDVQDESRDLADYDPGAAYWDVMALDVYGKSGFTQEKYDDALRVAGKKPVAIGECAVLPKPEVLSGQPRWVFFMAWAGRVTENTPEQIKALYDSPRVLTLDKLPPHLETSSVLNAH